MPKVYMMIDDDFIRKFFKPKLSWNREYSIKEYDPAMSKYSIKKYNLEEMNTPIREKLENGNYCPEKLGVQKLVSDYFSQHEPGKFVGMVVVDLVCESDHTIHSFDIRQIKWTDGMGFQWLLTENKNRLHAASRNATNVTNATFWQQLQKVKHPVESAKCATYFGTKQISPKRKKQQLQEYIAYLGKKQYASARLIIAEIFLLQLYKDDITDWFHYSLETNRDFREHIYVDSDGNEFGTIFEIAKLLEKKLDVKSPSQSTELDEQDGGTTTAYYETMSFNSKNT